MEVLFKISNNELVLRYFNKRNGEELLDYYVQRKVLRIHTGEHAHITSKGGPAGRGRQAALTARTPVQTHSSERSRQQISTRTPRLCTASSGRENANDLITVTEKRPKRTAKSVPRGNPANAF